MAGRIIANRAIQDLRLRSIRHRHSPNTAPDRTIINRAVAHHEIVHQHHPVWFSHPHHTSQIDSPHLVTGVIPHDIVANERRSPHPWPAVDANSPHTFTVILRHIVFDNIACDFNTQRTTIDAPASQRKPRRHINPVPNGKTIYRQTREAPRTIRGAGNFYDRLRRIQACPVNDRSIRIRILGCRSHCRVAAEKTHIVRGRESYFFVVDSRRHINIRIAWRGQIQRRLDSRLGPIPTETIARIIAPVRRRLDVVVSRSGRAATGNGQAKHTPYN